MTSAEGLPWSDGEQRMHQWLGVPENDNPTAPYLTAQAAYAVQNFPLLAIGVLDRSGNPWTTVCGVTAGQARSIGQNLVGFNTIVADSDPIARALSEQEFEHQMISGLSIDLVRRKRVKLFGKILAGRYSNPDLQMIVRVDQSLGNCPKYLNKKTIHPIKPSPKLLSDASTLDNESARLIEKADLFFMTTVNPGVDMDTNHRGGSPGFVQVQTSTKIIYPEYSGNRLYQSLGNIVSNPLVALCFPDFETGDVLYITGTAKISVGKDAASKMPHSTLVVEVTIKQARFVAQGLPIRGEAGEFSPYNPKSVSSNTLSSFTDSGMSIHATMIAKQIITSTIAEYRFKTDRSLQYQAGQWVAIDLSKELDVGYSHMRDEDPQSLNDDFVRTFTISSDPRSVPENEFEITVRTNGAVTNHLRRQDARSDLQVPILGTGGDFFIKQDHSSIGFIAGGVGITPLLGQIRTLSLALLTVIWVIRADDEPFVSTTFHKYPALAPRTTIFFTTSTQIDRHKVSSLKSAGVSVYERRPNRNDLSDVAVQKWYMCAGVSLRKQVEIWLHPRTIISENFDY